MKKITLLLAVFILTIGVQSYGQVVTPIERDAQRLEYNDDVRKMKRHRYAKRKRAFKRAKMRKRADRRQLSAMRRVARADGLMSPQEKAVIKRERRKMRRQNKRALKRRAIKRNQRLRSAAELQHGRS